MTPIIPLLVLHNVTTIQDPGARRSASGELLVAAEDFNPTWKERKHVYKFEKSIAQK
jgi:hypothetical protein